MGIEAHQLTRRFGNRLAVDQASFRIEKGRLTGFVGANGAGKTTVMRMILGVLEPTSGTVTLDGVPLDQPTRRSFGYMPEERGLYPKMPLREQMIYFARLHGLGNAEAAANADELLQILNLADRGKDPIESLSLGNQQRAQVAVALVHRPSALILDEPFSGLDPMAVDVILSVLMRNAERGIPVFLSSHQLDLIERLCDDLVIIADGKVVASGSIAGLQRQYNRGRYHLQAGQDLSWLQLVPRLNDVKVVGDTATFAVSGDEGQQEYVTRQILRQAVQNGSVSAFGPESTALAEIFREAVEDTRDDAEAGRREEQDA